MGSDQRANADREKQMQASLQCCSMKGLENVGLSLHGIELSTLVRFDTIVVRTVNSDYRIFLLEPQSGRALLVGGRKITEPVEALVIGSTLDGSILRSGWIGVGLRINAWANDSFIRTSPVQSFWVEHQTSPELTTNISQ